MRKVGTVKEIWRYPVKGMAGEQVERCGLGKKGLTGDRIWALRDTTRREIQSCKFRPELLLCSARCRGGDASGPNDQVDVVFPDGEVRPCLNSTFSFGKITDQDFFQIWNSRAAREFCP